jgi:hypothetical protein
MSVRHRKMMPTKCQMYSGWRVEFREKVLGVFGEGKGVFGGDKCWDFRTLTTRLKDYPSH